MPAQPALMLGVLVGLPLIVSPQASADPIPITSVSLVDTLGSATTATTFSVFGSGGYPFFGLHAYGAQFVGPRFSLPTSSVLTSVGGFVNSCESIIEGVPKCVPASRVSVEIRPARSGDPNAGPDPDRLLASFDLSHDNNPFLVSFESATFRLPLDSGTYFALFALPSGEGGFVLDSAQDPFGYQALTTIFGVLDPRSGFSTAFELRGGVQVTATPVPEPSTLALLLVGGSAAATLRARRARRCRR